MYGKYRMHMAVFAPRMIRRDEEGAKTEKPTATQELAKARDILRRQVGGKKKAR